jgi:hypothetical protein
MKKRLAQRRFGGAREGFGQTQTGSFEANAPPRRELTHLKDDLTSGVRPLDVALCKW